MADIENPSEQLEASFTELKAQYQRLQDDYDDEVLLCTGLLRALVKADYGFCETCGIEIGLRRLEARPTATLCIDCKTLAEIKEKQNNG